MDFTEIMNIIKTFLNAIVSLLQAMGIKFGGSDEEETTAATA